MSNPRLQGLSLEGITVSFGGAPALDGVTLRVEPGERIAIVGASGAGKSTLFRALTRGVTVREGRVLVGGRDLYALSRRELRAARRRIGSVRQAYDLVPQLPVGVNAALGEVGGMGAFGTLRTLFSGPEPDLSARVGGALERLGLDGMAGSRTADLSGGQQQRVAVARLLVQRPNLVLADEPFAAVDPVTTEKVMGALLDLNREGATLLVNLHDVEIARRLPRVVALREGRVVFDGPPDGLTDERLSEVYAGEPRDAPGSAPSGDDLEARRVGDPVRVAEGRGGVSAH